MVEDDVRAARRLELGRDPPADSPEPTDDRVSHQMVDRATQPALRVGLRNSAVRDQVDDRACQVEEDCHSSDEERDREELRAVPGRLRVEARERRRHDGAVEGRDPPLSEDRLESDRAGGEDTDERDLGIDEATPVEASAHAGPILGGPWPPLPQARSAGTASGVDTTRPSRWSASWTSSRAL